ncbi:FAD-dependent oxidoreductase [Rhizocola hellebori]|uniref:FAD-dependent oxidoreductase n=1 Tax=Rhizocola hellebori TaxID=1392758 RepID=UPI001944F3ED|nr:NAD(P)/FAD-dependent oxidoreductase [Rhizocola hellebori]
MGRSHAVVIGASVAGLTAAQALASRFDRVTVLDRDILPDNPVPRRGVPQGHHPHVLLASGQAALDELFPGVKEELVAGGAVPFEAGRDMCIHRFGVVWPPADTGLHLVSFSRPFLETTLRGRLLAHPNVSIRDGVAIAALTGSSLGVTGVRLDDGETLAANLVVDATGRGSRSDRWLANLDFPVPEAAEVKIGVGYSTRVFRREPGFLPEGVCVFILPTPPRGRRAGLILPIEGDRWLVSIGGWHGQFPKDEAEFQRFAKELPYPAIADLLRDGEPLSEVVSYGFPSSRRRYFEKLRLVPGGFVTTGDAVCSFNPIYGQGMTCAALDALALGRMLDKHSSADAAMARDYYREVGSILATPWRFAAGGDFAFPETQGPRPPGIALLNRYSRRVQLAARYDPVVRRVFSSVQHLVIPPSALFQPSIVAKVVRGSRSVNE